MRAGLDGVFCSVKRVTKVSPALKDVFRTRKEKTSPELPCYPGCKRTWEKENPSGSHLTLNGGRGAAGARAMRNRIDGHCRLVCLKKEQ